MFMQQMRRKKMLAVQPLTVTHERTSMLACMAIMSGSAQSCLRVTHETEVERAYRIVHEEAVVQLKGVVCGVVHKAEQGLEALGVNGC